MNRFQDAIDISAGACNPIAITGVIHKHMLEMLDKGMTTIRQDPAIRLMVYQLAYLCGADGSFNDFTDALKACASKAKEEADVPDTGKAPS
jgi:hypothetical protein